MIVFFHCTRVQVHGVTLRSAPNWTMHLQDVQDAALSGFQILNNPEIPNNDGIDCIECRHVWISDCHIDAGDDDFAIVASEHVNVSTCSLSSRSAAHPARKHAPEHLYRPEHGHQPRHRHLRERLCGRRRTGRPRTFSSRTS